MEKKWGRQAEEEEEERKKKKTKGRRDSRQFVGTT